MEQLEIKNFGPIKSLDINLKPLSVIIGEQSSGKSTIAKLFATFSWLEKALIRGQLTEKGVSRKGYLQSRCKYHHIEDFFETNSFIRYDNKYYTFIQENNRLKVEKKEKREKQIYDVPQITYFPAERSLLTMLLKENALPDSFPDLKYLFDKAKDLFFAGFELPWGDIFEYNRQNKISYIRPKNSSHRIKLSASSSGTRCALPLLLVIKYLTNTIYEGDSEKNFSANFDKIRKDILKIYNNKIYSDETRNVLIRSIVSKYRSSYLLNIVEEPEQNLFPSAQKDVFLDLLEMTKFNKGGRLLLTTHSPYILTILNCILKKSILFKKYEGNEQVLEELDKIFPAPIISQNNISAYMLDKGKVTSIINKENKLILAKLMDSVSDEISSIFEKLLDFDISHDSNL